MKRPLTILSLLLFGIQGWAQDGQAENGNVSGRPVPCQSFGVSVGSVTNVSCFGADNGSASTEAFGGTAPYTYDWTPGHLKGAQQYRLPAGIYTVTATDAAGCTGTQTVVVNQPTELLLQTESQPASCGQSDGKLSVSVQGGTTPYRYDWSPLGGDGPEVSDLPAGRYSLTVTDFRGCRQTALPVVINEQAPTVNLVMQGHISCYGGNDGALEIAVSGGKEPYRIEWRPDGGQNALAENLHAGQYTAAVTDAAGCVATQTGTLTDPTALVLGAASSPAGCGLSDGSAAVAVNGGTPPYTYRWSPYGGNSDLALGLAAGSYTVTVTDLYGCSQNTSVEVGSTVTDSSLQVLTRSTAESCLRNDGTAQVLVSGGVGPYTYRWSGGVERESPGVEGLAAGTYSVTVSDRCYSVTQPVTVEQGFVIPKKDLPNVITPNRDAVNDMLYVGNQFEAGEDFYCVIYNRWGVPIFKTENKSISWAPKHITDGTYYIVVSYRDCTGTHEKISSTITVTDSVD